MPSNRSERSRVRVAFGRTRSVGRYALLAMLTLASSALAQPPAVRTKPVIDHQLEVEARHDKRAHEKAHEQQLRAHQLTERRQHAR